MRDNWTAEEIEYILDQGLEKLASMEEEGDDVYSDEFVKVAEDLSLAPEELEYVLSEGFDKVAADAWHASLRQSAGAAKDALTNAASKALSGGRKGIDAIKGLPRPAQVGLGAGLGLVGAGVAAQRIRKGRDNEGMQTKAASIDWSRVADEDFQAIFELGLEKIAAGGAVKNLLGKAKSGVGGAAKAFGRLPMSAKAGIGAAGLGAAGLNVGLALKRRRAAEDAETAEKTASGLSEEELQYILEKGLEKVAEEQQASPADLVRAMLAE